MKKRARKLHASLPWVRAECVPVSTRRNITGSLLAALLNVCGRLGSLFALCDRSRVLVSGVACPRFPGSSLAFSFDSNFPLPRNHANWDGALMRIRALSSNRSLKILKYVRPTPTFSDTQRLSTIATRFKLITEAAEGRKAGASLTSHKESKAVQ